MSSWLPLLKLWGYGSLALIAAGNFVAQMTFLHMSWQTEAPKTRKSVLSRVWITGAQAQRVISSFQHVDPASKLPLLNKLGGISAIAGLVGTVAWVITICLLIVHLKG